MDYYHDHYSRTRRRTSTGAPRRCCTPDHAGLPPAFVLTAGYDPLRDEGLQYAQQADEAGSRATLVNFERQIHGFITMGRVIDEANVAVQMCAAQLRGVRSSKAPQPSYGCCRPRRTRTLGSHSRTAHPIWLRTSPAPRQLQAQPTAERHRRGAGQRRDHILPVTFITTPTTASPTSSGTLPLPPTASRCRSSRRAGSP